MPRVRAELVGRRRKALLVVPTSASPICSFPAGPQGFSSFPWQLEARGAEQGLGRGCAADTWCAGVASTWPGRTGASPAR